MRRLKSEADAVKAGYREAKMGKKKTTEETKATTETKPSK